MHVYLDAMVWIYALENHPTFGTPALELLRHLRAGRHRIITSHFLLAEILVLPTRSNNSFSVASYRRALLSSDFVQVAPFDTTTAINFAQLRASQRIK